MAQRMHAGTPAASFLVAQRDAHNASHAINAGSQVHNDGPEYEPDASGSPARMKKLLCGTGSPLSAQAAADFLLLFKNYYNEHRLYADEVSGELWYAHKVADTTNGITLGMSPWDSTETQLLEAARVLLNDLCTRYEGHRLNNGGNYHGATDTDNALSTPITFSSGSFTAQIGVERTNLLKFLYNDHRVLTSGGVHDSADTTHAVTAVNATYSVSAGADWTKWIALLLDLKTQLIAHAGDATAHIDADSTNIPTAAVPAVGAGTFDMANQIASAWNAHCASTTFHNIADTGNQVATTSVTTIAHMIALAQELYTKVNVHVQAAPLSRSIRLVV